MKPSLKPNRDELRAAITYVRKQFRVMFPKHNPQRHPKYRETVFTVARYTVKLRRIKELGQL